MKKWKMVCAGLVTFAGLSPNLWAQAVPSVPAVPGVPAAPGVPGAPAAPAVPPDAPPATFFQKFGLTKDQCAAMRRKCCQSQFGQLIGNMMKPVSVFTGGVMGNFCPQTPSNADLAQPPGSAVGEAARIQKDEAEAGARRAAVRYLGTVDCHFRPEAKAALINSLRKDRNECVRWEAAMALGSGCCCTKETMEALLISATGSDRDGNAAETCERVRAAAYASLQHCLACYCKEEPAEPLKKGNGEIPKGETPKGPISSAEYEKQLRAKPMSRTVDEAKQALSTYSVGGTSSSALPGGQRGLANIFSQAMGGTPAPSAPMESMMAPTVHTREPAMVMDKMPSYHEPMPIQDPTPVGMSQFKPVPAPTSEIKPSAHLMDIKPAAPAPTSVIVPAQTPVFAPAPTTIHTPAATPASPVPVSSFTPTPAPVYAPAAMPAYAPAPVSKPTPAPSSMVPAPTSTPSSMMTPAPMSTQSSMMTPAPSRPITPVVYTPAPTVTPAANTSARGPGSLNTPQLLQVLRNSIYPVQREWAVRELSNLDWHSNPEAVQALMNSAHRDSVTTVRIECIRALARMKADTVPVVTSIQGLKSDTDPRVQHEAELALGQMKSASSVASMPHSGAIQPASATMPSSTFSPVQPAYRPTGSGLSQ